jgi:radical SAM protein with 4Fe4S-binding SPASM domain
MCPNKDLKKEDLGDMDFDLYKKIIDEAAEFVFEVNLAHRGESLLHPRLVDAIDYAKKRNIYTRLHTNGSLLTEDISRKLVDCGLDRLSFSFDGYEKKTYEKIRKNADFDKTIENIVRFLEIKKEAGSKTPGTAIEVINFDSIRKDDPQKEKDFKNRFSGLPLDNMVMKELHNWAGELKKKGVKESYSVCPFPWNALIICWDGSVLPCTQDFFKVDIVGNVKATPLKVIWNNEKMISLREDLARGRLSHLKPCSECDRVWRKGFLGVPREYLWKFLTKRMP